MLVARSDKQTETKELPRRREGFKKGKNFEPFAKALEDHNRLVEKEREKVRTASPKIKRVQQSVFRGHLEQGHVANFHLEQSVPAK